MNGSEFSRHETHLYDCHGRSADTMDCSGLFQQGRGDEQPVAKVVTAFDRVCIVRGLRCASVTYSRHAPSEAPCPAGATPFPVLRETFTTDC